MSLKDGYAAISQIQASGQKLGEVIGRIESLERKLADLSTLQGQIVALLTDAKAVFSKMELASEGLSKRHDLFEALTEAVPNLVTESLADAEERITEQQTALAAVADDMPTLVERVVQEKLTGLMTQLETRISAHLRDELKDTRSALRDAMEANARSHEAKLAATAEEIVSEMPRGLLGRRGR